MQVIAICSYPTESAATRFRLVQFVEPLGERGIKLTIAPFFDSKQFGAMYSAGGSTGRAISVVRSVVKRVGLLFSMRKFDVMVVQREAMFFGPAIFERLYRWIGNTPMILDLDDATYVPYVSPSYGRLGSYLKFFGKTDQLIRAASVVVCGNRFIAEYVEGKGSKAVVIPTIVDPNVFVPVEKENSIPVIGWIGTHSTFPFLESLFPVFTRLAASHKFVLKVVGAGIDNVNIDGVDVINLPWDADREIADFQSMDIGVYPIVISKSANEEWIKGKSGFKAIQYMAVGVPFVMSPVGVCAEIGMPGKTHFNAVNQEDWYNPLSKLLSGRELRIRMGNAGRCLFEQDYCIEKFVDTLAETFRFVVADETPTNR
ncbi:MAG: glycosyltransferase family 4 protein [Chloracidobacterium sp.]|nr:glycosyltransferase family 4 protein [Chloracidobacterium sp.]